LARLSLTEEEKEKFVQEFEGILAYVEQIKEVSSDIQIDKKPENYPHRNVMRDDVSNRDLVTDGQSVVASAPESQAGYVKVKKILNN
jgi:aspartyl-tRNA(Asn)/glutamyl-tRNA(Gln) amidotransferase subunit C